MATRPLRPGDPGDWFSTPAWRRSVLPLDAPRARAERPILVLGSDSPLSAGLVEALRAEGRPVLLALAGETVLRGGPEWFVVRPGEPRDLESLIETLLAEGRLPVDIAHLWTLAPDEAQAPPAVRFARARDRAYTSLLALARALGRRGLGPRTCVHVLSNGIQEVAGEGVLAPLSALLLGPARVAPREFPGLRVRSLDLHVAGEVDGLAPDLARRLLAEFVAEAPDDLVAFRGRERLVGSFAPLRLAERPGGASWLRERGVYVVAGGLGGVGLAVAELLARRVRARLVLLGRRGLPPRELWGTWLAQHGELESTSRRIRRVQALETLGAEALPLAAELTDPEALRTAIAEARARFGAIHGVFLTAGARGEGAIRWKGADSEDRVLAPRVVGALALEAALGDAQPDFLLMHSSLAGAAGLPGQVDAAAADAFLGAFAAARSAAGQTSFCVSWGAWRDAGVAAERERAIEQAERTQPCRPLAHPVLRRSLGNVLGEEVLLGELSADASWWLAEHGARGRGALLALLPGAAHAELARAAHAVLAGEGPVEIRDLCVRAPLALAAGERCALRVRVGRASGEVAVESRAASDAHAEWVLHADARVLPVAGSAPQRPLAEIRRRCAAQRLRLDGPLPHAHLALGPRFACLRAVGYGDGELLAELALPDDAAAEVAQHGLHAALVEMATGCALALLPGYNPVRDFYLPTAYARIRVWESLPARVACHVRHRRLSDERAGAAFDATFLDDEGRELAAIEALRFAAIEDPEALRRGGEGPARASEACAIHVGEGLASLERLLSHEPPAQLLVCPQPLDAWLAAIARASARSDADAAAPADEAERALWELASAGLERAA
jgi:NAD(P)-dependent dehydrogenase (short-subunit alcohol dehydrogenase family)